MSATVKPTGDRILAKELPYEYHGKIALPEKSRMDYQLSQPRIFEVLAVGPGRTTKKGIPVPIEVYAGDRILVSTDYDGPIRTTCGDYVINYSSVIAFWQGPFTNVEPKIPDALTAQT